MVSDAIVGRVQNVPGAKLVAVSQPAAVLVVLQNGLVKSVVPPGKRVGRFWRASPIGVFQVIEVNAGWFSVRRTITNVTAAPEANGVSFQAPSVTLQLTGKINDSGNYHDLRAIVNEAGLGLADALVAALTNGIERSVRNTFARQPQSFWRGAALTQEFERTLPVGQTFGPPGYEKLIMLRSLDEVTAEQDPSFLEQYGAEMKVAIAASQAAAAQAEAMIENARALATAHGQAEINRIEAASRVEVKRVEADGRAGLYTDYAAVAAQLNLPIEALIDPEKYTRNDQEAHEVAKILAEGAPQGLLYRVPGLSDVFRRYGDNSATPPPHSIDVSRVRPDPLPLTGGVDDAEVELELTRNARLLRSWRSARPDDSVVGISFEQRNETGVLLCIVDGPAPDGTALSDLETQLARQFALERVSVVCVPMATTAAELVGRLLAAALPGHAGSVRVSVSGGTAGEDTLTILLASAAGNAAADMRDELLRPVPPLLGALSNLLPFDEIRVEATLR
jgi:hypothetical protein